jgi:hypothetical protein
MVTLHQVNVIEEVVSDVAPLDADILLESNQTFNKVLEPHGQDGGDEFDDVVL